MRQPKGVLVLLSLVILSIIASAGLVLGTIIIRQIRLSTISDKGITALYAAETAAEDSIYHVFKLGQDPTTLSQSGSLSNGATWTRATKKTDSQFVFDFLQTSQTAEVDLYNTAQPNQAAGVESFAIDWSSGSGLSIEVSEWDGAALTPVLTQSTSCTGAPCSQVVINTPASNKAYLIQLTALGSSVTDLVVTTYSFDGGPATPGQTRANVEIPVTVVATGIYQGAKQAIQLRVPVLPPWLAAPAPVIPAAVCGNSIVESGETCDDGNTVSGDGCSATCQTEGPPPSPVCGNSILEGSEFCDDGDATNAGTCNATCTALTFCSDGTTQNPNGFSAAETCDDGNLVSYDGCHKNCRAESPNLSFSYVSSTNSCSDSPVTLQLVNNTGDPDMALGNYSFVFRGPVCSYIDFTTTSSIAQSSATASGADNPARQFVYMSEDPVSCGPHNLTIYDRERKVIRTARVENPCSQINYTPGSYDPKAIAQTVAAAHGWADLTKLSFDYVSHTSSCSDAFVTLKLVDNSLDSGMSLGNYNFEFIGPVCSYINFTDSSLVLSAASASGANDPSWRFVYISEQPGFGCSPHTMQIYDRQTHSIRTANISSPCTQINYSSGSYNPKQVAANIAAANGW